MANIVSPEDQRARDVNRAAILQQEIRNDPSQEAARGKELGYLPPDVQQDAQTGFTNKPAWVSDKQSKPSWVSSKEPKQADDFLSNAIGGNLAVAKGIMSLPGFIGGGINAAAGLMTGRDKPSEALEGMMGAGADFSEKAFQTLLNALPDSTAQHLKHMYESVGGQATEEFMSQMFDFSPIGQGYGNIAAAVGANPELSKQIDASVQLALNAGLLKPEANIGKVKPGKIPLRTGADRIEPTNIGQVPDVNVNGKSEPWMNDYQQLGADAYQEPSIRTQPQMPPNQDPSMGMPVDIPPEVGPQMQGPGVPPPAPTQYNFKGYEGGIPFEPQPGVGRPQTGFDPTMDSPTNGERIPVTREDFPSQQPIPEPARQGGPNVPFDAETARSPRMQPETIDYPANGKENYSTPEPGPTVKGQSAATFDKWVDTQVDKVIKDPVVGRQIKQIRSQMEYIDAKIAEAREHALDATRVREGDVGRTKKSAAETDRLHRQINNEQTILENLGNQLYERLKAKHPDTDPWFPREGKVGRLSVEESVDRIRNNPVNIRENYTKRGDNVVPLGKGPGGKQRGAIDLNALSEGARELWKKLRNGVDNWHRIATDDFGRNYPDEMNKDGPQAFMEGFKQETDIWQGKKGPAAFRQPINKGPGGKQSGATNFGFSQAIADRLRKSKTDKQVGLEHEPERKPTGLGARVTQFASTHDQLFKNIMAEARERGPVKDISGTQKLTYQDWTTGKSTAVLAEKVNGSGQVIKWVNDKIRYLDREAEGLAKQLLGYKTKEGAGALHPWKSLFKSEDGIFYKWDSHEVKKADIAGWHDAALNAMAELREPTRADFRSDKEYEIHKAIRRGLDKALDFVNQARESIGLKPIEKIPGYLPTMIKGGYRLVGRDINGATKIVIGAETRNKVNKWLLQGLTAGLVRPTALSEIRAKLEKQHPDITFHEIPLKDGDKKGLSDLSAFEEAMRALKADDPAAKALHATYVEILKARGFGSHSLQRKGGWTGFEGSERGYDGAKKMRESIETWMHQAMQYRANIGKQSALREVLESDGTKWSMTKDDAGNPIPHKESMIEKEIPNTIKYITDYVGHSMGKDLLQWDYLDSRILDWSQELGFGRDMPTEAVNRLGNLASFMWLTRPAFLMVQAVQHLNFAPQAVKLGIKGTMDSPLKGYFQGWKNYIAPDALAKEAVGWAVDNHYLDSKIINAFDSGYGWDGKKAFGNVKDWKDGVAAASEAAPKFSRFVIGKVEQEMARIPTFLWAESAMRKSVPNKAERFQLAAELTDHYMVNYTSSERPMVYNRAGLGGVFLNKLKQYSHNYYGQFFEYLGDLKRDDPKSFAPMATFMANNIMQAGLKGMIFLELGNGMMNVANYLANTNYPTPEELLFSSGLSDWLVFGGASTISGAVLHHGYDVSSSLAAPQMQQMGQSPAVEMAGGIAKGAKTAIDMLHGEATPGQKFNAAKSLVPSVGAGLVEKAFSADGNVVPKAKGNDLVTDYTRDAEEWAMRMFFGPRSVDEAKISAEMNMMNRKMERDTEISARMTSVMFDKFVNGNPISEADLNKYMMSEDGTVRGDPEKLAPAFIEKMKKELISRANLMLIKQGSGMSEIEKLQRMKQFGLIVDQASPEEIKEIGKAIQNQ